jgi:transcriptional regulator with XRE-family HTH domain
MTEMRRRRKAAGLTLADVARRSGVNYSTVQNLDAGLGKNYNVKFKKAIADVLAKALGLADPEFFSVWPEELKKIRHVREFIK